MRGHRCHSYQGFLASMSHGPAGLLMLSHFQCAQASHDLIVMKNGRQWWVESASRSTRSHVVRLGRSAISHLKICTIQPKRQDYAARIVVAKPIRHQSVGSLMKQRFSLSFRYCNSLKNRNHFNLWLIQERL